MSALAFRPALVVFVVLTCCLGTCFRALGATITFDDQPNGKIINNQYASQGVTISALNYTAGHPNLAITFDSGNKNNTADLDLQIPWSKGNLPSSTKLKNVLIVAENNIDKNKDGLIDSPDDEGDSQPAGVLKFKFSTPQNIFGMDLVDCDGMAEIGPSRGFISFISSDHKGATVGFGNFITAGNPYYDSTVKYADRSANRLKPINTNQLGIRDFTEVDVNLGWSTAIDTITFSRTLLVPEPTTASSLLMMVCAAGFIPRRRQRIAA
jgi:hypothetical protein